MTVKISAVKQTELEQLKKISETTFKETFTKDNTPADLAIFLQQNYNLKQLQQELDNGDSFFYFIYQDAQLAGYLKLNIGEAQSEKSSSESLEIARIYILAAFKRQGLGHELMQFAEKVAKEKQKKEIWLGVWEYNPVAIAFYKKMGFVKKGEHVFTIGTDDQTDWVMTKYLN